MPCPNGNNRQCRAARAVRELVTVKQTITDKSIYHKNLMPVTYVIVVSRCGGKSGVCHFENEWQAGETRHARVWRRWLTAESYNAVLPFSDQQPAMKWDGEWHITIEVFRISAGVRCRAGADLRFDGRLVQVVSHAHDCHGCDSVFRSLAFCGARNSARFFTATS